MTEAINEITVASWRSYRKDSLRGFLTLQIADGLVLHDCSLHQRDGARWIGLPVRRYTKDGETAWARIVDFATKESYSRFQKAALAAVDRHFAAQSAESATVSEADAGWAALGGKR